MQTAFYSPVGREYQRIPYGNVLYIVAKNNYSTIVTASGTKICIYATLSCLEAKLPKNLFARVHRSYIVSLKRIERFQRPSLIIKGEVIPVGNQYYEVLHERLNIICNDNSFQKIKKRKNESIDPAS